MLLCKSRGVFLVKLSELTKSYYKPGEVARMLGVTARAVMLYDDKGQIEFERTATGRRIIAKDKLVEYLEGAGLLVCDLSDKKHDVVYARVSTHKQKERGDLDRQTDSLLAFVADKEPRNLLILKEVGSGLNDNRKSLLKLIGLMLNGHVSRIFIAYKDRLTRFGFNYLKAVAEHNKVEIIIMSTEIVEKTVQEELAEDLVSIIHSFSGKLYGMRRKAFKQLEESVDILRGRVDD